MLIIQWSAGHVPSHPTMSNLINNRKDGKKKSQSGVELDEAGGEEHPVQ